MILNKTSCKNPMLSHISAKPPVQSSTIFIAKIMRDVHINQQLGGMLEIAVIKLFSPCSILLLTSALQLLPHSPLSSSHTASAFSSAITPDPPALPPAFFLSKKKKMFLSSSVKEHALIYTLHGELSSQLFSGLEFFSGLLWASGT